MTSACSLWMCHKMPGVRLVCLGKCCNSERNRVNDGLPTRHAFETLPIKGQSLQHSDQPTWDDAHDNLVVAFLEHRYDVFAHDYSLRFDCSHAIQHQPR